MLFSSKNMLLLIQFHKICKQGCITITNLYYIFIFYTISFYSPILLLFILQISLFFVVYFSFSFFILQFLTGEESLGGYTVNKPLLLSLLLYQQNTRVILSFYFARAFAAIDFAHPFCALNSYSRSVTFSGIDRMLLK